MKHSEIDKEKMRGKGENRESDSQRSMTYSSSPQCFDDDDNNDDDGGETRGSRRDI